jgi:putative membrane protein
LKIHLGFKNKKKIDEIDEIFVICLVILTIPITIITLGLFLIVINYFIIRLTTQIVPGFSVDGWLPALLFSLLVSFVSSIIEAIAGSSSEK